jgi:hypothetical protein
MQVNVRTSKAGVILGNVSWNGNLGWLSAASSGHCSLGTGDVVLWATGNVKSDLLNTDKIISGRDGLGNREGESRFVYLRVSL